MGRRPVSRLRRNGESYRPMSPIATLSQCRQSLAACCCSLSPAVPTAGCFTHPRNRSMPTVPGNRSLLYNDRKIELFIAQSPGVMPASPPRAYSLEFTGNSTRAEQVASQSAKMWGNRPVEVWVMNYPGFGESDGPSKLASIPPIALMAFDLIRKTSRGKPIFLKGYSMGTTAALCVAARRPCAGIILQSPPPLQQEIMQRFGWWNLWVVASLTAAEVPDELNSLTNAPKVHVPALFIISGKDQLVPPEFQMMVVNAYPGDKKCLLRKDASHNLPISTRKSGPAGRSRLALGTGECRFCVFSIAAAWRSAAQFQNPNPLILGFQLSRKDPQLPSALPNPADERITCRPARLAQNDSSAAAQMPFPKRLQEIPIKPLVQNVGTDDEVESFAQAVLAPVQLPCPCMYRNRQGVQSGKQQGRRFEIRKQNIRSQCRRHASRQTLAAIPNPASFWIAGPIRDDPPDARQSRRRCPTIPPSTADAAAQDCEPDSPALCDLPQQQLHSAPDWDRLHG